MRIVEVRHNCGSSEQVTLEYGQVAVFYCARSGSCNTAYENTGAGALYECVDDDSVRRGAIAVHQATTGVEVVTMGVAPVTPGCVHDHALVVLDVDLVDISHLDVIVAAVASTTSGSAAAALNYGGRNLPGNNLASPWGPWASTSGLGGIEVAWFGRSDNQGTLGLGRTVTRGAEYVSKVSERDSGWAVSMTTISPGYGPAPNDVHLDGMSVFSNAPSGARRLAGSLVLWGPFVELRSAARIRSHVSENAGSLFQATQAVAVESAASEAFPYATTLPERTMRAFREALTPETVAFRYHPIPTRNQEMLVTVEGETNLGRMASTYPSPIMTLAAALPGSVGGRVTAQQAIQYVVNQWSAEHPWLVFEPIPDLRLLVPEAVSDPRQYYLDNPTAGVLTTSNIVIEQEGNERRTMREVLDEWLRIFPGTILRQTSAGTIEIVPRVGPDAPDGPALELSWRDFARFSDGEDDPRGVYNRARTTSQGWEWEEEHPLLPPLVTVGARGDSAPASAVDDLLPLDTEPLPNNQEREFSTLVDLSVPVQVDVVFRAVTFGNKAGSGAPTVEATIPASFNLSPFAVNQHTFTWTIFNVDHVRTTVNFKRSANGFTVEIPAANRYVFGPNPFVGMRYGVYIVEVTSVTGTAWTRSNTTVEAEWGTEEHHVPAEGGGDALAQSRALYGVRSASLQSNVFQLTPEQAMDVARSYVLFNINPRTIRDVEQSPWDKYPVKFDHIGRYVELPNGEVAVVENRSYSDSFAPRASAMMSTFTATVSHSVIDTTTEFMYLDSGDYAQLDDGSLVEAS